GESQALIETLIGLKRTIPMLLVEHDMDVVARLCDPVVVMANGATLTEGAFHEIVEDERVQDAYLGRRT
ncbi:MAG: ABC transporter ATP-binding protein, partial [Pseudomonadota bacterium]